MLTGPRLDTSAQRAQSSPSTLRLLVVAAAGTVLLGTAYVVTGLLPEAPLWNAAMRVLPAGLVMLAVHPALPDSRWLWRSILLGTLNFSGFFAAQAFALHRVPGGVAATIAALQAVLVPLAATALLGERLRLTQVATATAGVAGIALLVLRSTEHLDAAGIAASAMLAIFTTAGMTFTRRWELPPGVTHTTATAWQMLGGGLLLVPVALFVEGGPPSMTLASWAVTAWLAVGATALAFTALFGSLHLGLPPTSLSRLMLLCPLVATVAGWIAFNQSLTAVQTIGAAIVLVSVAAVCPPRPTPIPREPSTDG